MAKRNVSTDVKENIIKVLEEIKNRVDNPSWDGELQEWAVILLPDGTFTERDVSDISLVMPSES